MVDRNAQLKHKQWSITRGDDDIISQQHSQIAIEEVLKPNDSCETQRLMTVIDGPPGIGKTTLCYQLLNKWAKGEFKDQYDLVLYCPLRNITVAQANKLEQFLNYNYKCEEVSMVTKHLEREHGKGLLIIFDGWDELSTKLKKCSFPTSIISNKCFSKCSIIVTSRSYATSSLLKVTSVNKHVEVMGFLEKEIKTVIKGTLKNEPKTAQKLISDLQVRHNVLSLCYVPLICAIVIHVFEVNQELPATLSKLYEDFILQAIRKFVANTGDYDPEDIQSLKEKHLPPNIATSFKEMCHFAYNSLKENNPKMTFSSIEIQQHLKQTGYLGLIRNYNKDGYQFLHLSIQEFLAAWWIAKYSEQPEDIFNAHFNDDHFRMCLQFIAGLTQLKCKKYEQYFNKELDLQCQRRPLFGFDACYRSRLYQNPEIKVANYHHVSLDDDDNKFDILLQLLYESQNETLCQVLSRSISNHSLCLRSIKTMFAMLCFSYFLNNSKLTWNHLDLGTLNDEKLEILVAALTNNLQYCYCNILQVELSAVSIKQASKFFQLSFFLNIQQCYITLWGYSEDFLYNLILSLLHLHQLTVVHLYLDFFKKVSGTTIHYPELVKHFELNCTLQELLIENGTFGCLPMNLINQICNGVASHKSIKSFTLGCTELPDEAMQHLLKNNHTLQALDVCNELPTSLNILEVNTPLTAMGVKILNLSHIKGLQYLKLQFCRQTHLILSSYLNLQLLDVSLYTAELVNELLIILQTNTMLKALRLQIMNINIYNSIGNCLRDMLTINQTLRCLEIDSYHSTISSVYMPYLTTGLLFNNSLQELSVPIPLSHTNNQPLQAYFYIMSQKYKLAELKLYFTLDETCGNCSLDEEKQIMTSLYYEQGLPLVTMMLKLHATVRLLQVRHKHTSLHNANIKHNLHWIESVQDLLQTVFFHPSLKYIGIQWTELVQNIVNTEKKTLINKCKQLQLKPPIVDIGYF